MYRIHYEILKKDGRSAAWHMGMPTTGGMSPEQWKEYVAAMRASSAPLIRTGRLLRIGYEAFPADGSMPSSIPDIFSRINFPKPS